MKRKLLIGVGIAFFGLVSFIVAVAVSNWMIQERVPIQPLASLRVIGDKQFAMAQGTFVTEGERSAMPLQSSEIKCSASTMQCIVGQGMITSGSKLYVTVDSYPIVEWSNSHLVYIEDANCVTTTFTLNWATESVTGIRKKKRVTSGLTDCSGVLTDELRITMKGGFEVWMDEQRRAWPAFIKLINAFF